MAKQTWKAGNMIYPLPAVMVSCQREDEKPNIVTVAWTGTICTNPPMAYISVRPQRHSYDIIKESGEFVINLTTEDLVRATDFCGVRSGRDVDKYQTMKLTPEKASIVNAPLIKESPVNIECKVKEIVKLGSHDMFIADVVAVNVDDKYMDSKGKFHLAKAKLMAYSHGEYYSLGKLLGTFGYSVKKKGTKKK
ncbi:flavoredoxin [Lachnospiraceae bacterium KM106-2]|nr:flavoredoxin [Lachnospiraceae bacterium KM106-2]